MPQTIRALFVLFIVSTLVGCAQRHLAANPERHLQDPRVGERIDLLQPIVVPAGGSQGWFDPQFYQRPTLSIATVLGPTRQRDGLKCGLQIARPLPDGGADLTIEPGHFSVQRVSRATNPYGIDPTTVSLYDGFADDVTLIYRVHVQSSQQPQVSMFFCSQRYATLMRGTAFPSAAQLRQQANQKLIWPQPTSTTQ